MTDCICRFQGRSLDRPQTNAPPDGNFLRVPNAEAVRSAFVKSAAGIKTAEDPQMKGWLRAGIIVDAALRSETE